MLQRLTGNLYRTIAFRKRKYGYFDLFAKHLQLLNGRRAVNIPGHEQRTMVALQQQLSQLG
ncbi:hypothetical protein D3C77_807620 [compost metagenome]